MARRQRPSSLSPVYVESDVISVQVQTYPGQGILEVYVYFSGVEVTATVTIIDSTTGQEVGTYITPEEFPITLDTGNYILYAYYEEYRASQTVEVKEGQTTIWRVYMEPKPALPLALILFVLGVLALIIVSKRK